ncbi:PREDICTED: uncharacterized protein LOC108620094 [Drosophila arizonae]|uniref:Uncharacterized protein LOC108620094 n=1 Tax=Drosophila arizonae TaxID=7263 RepID=A0ABM1PZ18_DROAR|nr:PREDICTED: uncharacterized protein LOC108620094 [Drosophila arizonae]
MAIKLFTLLAIGLALAAVIDARHVSGHRRHPQQQRGIVAKPHHGAQTRVFPGAVAIKKLVLLKFKKIVPISLILLKSSNDNEAELVPVYPTDQIPENVQFIPTPNGISGHKDVQAIAIPSELHEQLQINGLSNVENIEALLQGSSIIGDSVQSEDGASPVGNSIAVAQPEDAPLVQNDNDDTQLLEGATVPAVGEVSASTGAASTRRLSSNELLRSGIRNSAQLQKTSVEEIPLLLYSATDGGAPGQEVFGERRFVAATPARRRHHQFYN